jgi:uncharacterized protein (DUF58 family)
MPVSLNHQEIQSFSQLELLAHQVVEGFITGLHKSPFHGFSVEFAEHRLYNKGEPTKHIDWKLFGRTDKLFLKRYEEETNLRCQLVIDDSSSMYFPFKENGSSQPNKITFSIYCAAALMLLLKKQRDAVGLSIFGDSVEVNTATKSSSLHHKLLMTELEKRLQPIGPDVKRKTMAVEALHEIAESIHKRSLVILFSDMFDSRTNSEDLFSALQHLRHNKHEVILFHVVDKKQELDFEFENRPYRFVDVETGEELKLNPHEVKDHYIQAIQDFKSELKLRCGQYRIDFVEADINQGFDQVLLPYLLKRNRMK